MEVTLGGIAGLIIAVAILFFLGWVAYKIGAVLDAARDAVKDLTAETTPILSETKGLVTEVTNELVSVRDITDDVAKVSGHATDIADNASQLTSLIAATIGGPLVKVSAFSYGVRRAIAATRGKR
jgi:uncharacterized protein YoxC